MSDPFRLAAVGGLIVPCLATKEKAAKVFDELEDEE